MCSPGMPAAPNRSINCAGLVRPSIRILTTASSISRAPPPITVRCHLPAGGDHCRHRRRIALERHRHGIDRHRQVALGEGAVEPPETGPAAVFVKRLHVHIAHAKVGCAPIHSDRNASAAVSPCRIDYQYVAEAVEREHIAKAVAIHTQTTGTRPLGWYQGRCSPNTRRLVAEEGGFLYNADSYADDLPYWDLSTGKPQLIVPYAFDSNDMRFATAQGFNSGDQFFAYLKDTFDVLYREGESRPRIMSVGLHCRLAGRPGRTAALERFLDYAVGHERVWITRRIDIARHWIATHPFGGHS